MDAHEMNDKLTRATRQQNAAYMVLEARMKEFQAMQQVGSAKERETARTAVMAAMEAYLDAVESVAWWSFKVCGCDPEDRG